MHCLCITSLSHLFFKDLRSLGFVVRLGFVMSVRPSVRIEQLGSRWTDFHKVCFSIFPESFEKIEVPLISDSNNNDG